MDSNALFKCIRASIISCVKRSIKCGKSPGEDGLMPEELKYVPINDTVIDIRNKSYMKCEQPDLWNISIIVKLVPK